ncbi:MAG: hypothetical protein ACJA0U_000034 [Salibacteraceae bacterium]|jgi:hypothetical protein
MKKSFYFSLLILLACSSTISFGQLEFKYQDSILVLDNGDTLNTAWGGGINYGQFSDFDYDFDGDLDLFVFDRSSNNIRVFTQESNGNGKFYKLAYNSKSKFPIDVRYRATLVDYDNDGRKDLFTYAPGGLKVYRNVGDLANGLQWQLVKDLVKSDYPGGNFNLYITSSDIPAIIDVDADGDIDILTFHQGGYFVEYHQNQSMELYGIPDSLIYVEKNQCWGKFNEDPVGNSIVLNSTEYPCVGGDIANPERAGQQNLKKHSGSTLLALDYDDSGVLDLIVGDVSYTNMTLLINGGLTVNMDSPMISADTLFPSTSLPVDIQLFPAGYYLDVDFDGVKDLIVCPNAKAVSVNKRSVHFYKNTGTNTSPNFIFVQDNFLQSEMIENGTGSIPVLYDYNQDGLEDLLVANFFNYKPVLDKESTITYYQNTGTSTTPVFSFADADLLNLSSEAFGLRSVPAFGDLDGDGDADLLLGCADGTLIYYENTSSGGGSVFTTPMIDYEGNASEPIDVGEFSHPQIFDLNDDGLLDLIIGSKTGELVYYQNIGTINVPSFTLYNPTLGEVDVSGIGPDGYAAPHFFRNNGETHLFLGAIEGELNYYNGIANNIDPGQFFTLVSPSYLNIDVEKYSSFWVNDIDNDSRLDMFVGQDLGGVFHFEVDTNNYISILDLEIDPMISIYPNPTNSFITISSEHELKAYQFFDMSGKMILSNEITLQEELVDLSDIPQGFYFIRVRLKDGRESVKKLVKR